MILISNYSFILTSVHPCAHEGLGMPVEPSSEHEAKNTLIYVM